MKNPNNEFKGCVMVNLKINNWMDLQDLFEPEDLVNFKFEKEPHITLVYGLHSLTSAMVLNNILHGSKLIGRSVKLSKVGIFDTNPGYDLLKYEVTEAKLFSILQLQYKEITSSIENKQTFPSYNPHCSIAYIKKGTAGKYIKKMPTVEGYISDFWYSTHFKAD